MIYTGKERCCLCGGPLWDGKSEWKGGNNPEPLSDKHGARCCGECNQVVIYARVHPDEFNGNLIRAQTAILNTTNFSGEMARRAAIAAICAFAKELREEVSQ